MEMEIFGYTQEVYCRLCKSFLFSLEEIEREEMKLNKNATRETKERFDKAKKKGKVKKKLC